MPYTSSLARHRKPPFKLSSQHRGSPLRLGLDGLPPLGFGTRISYLARPPITPCRRFAIGVLLIGMGVRLPFVYTYSFIQFSTYDGGHLGMSKQQLRVGN